MTSSELREEQGERAWVRMMVPRLREALASAALPGGHITVGDQVKLPYTSTVQAYSKEGAACSGTSSYETDLLFSDTGSDGSWTPRLVIECKLGGVTTHDALSYAAKAETHKNVHPYLRYGFLAGKLASIPPRLVKHGLSFDFLATWPQAEPDAETWQKFVSTLTAEIGASRALQAILTKGRSATRYRLIRRPLVLG